MVVDTVIVGRRACPCAALHTMWRELLEEVVKVGTITTFKNHSDRLMDRRGFEGHGPINGKWD